MLQSQWKLRSEVKLDIEKCLFNSRLNSFESAVLRILACNAFYATGPETENALSPSFVRVLGTTYVGHVDDWRPWRWVEAALQSLPTWTAVAGVGFSPLFLCLFSKRFLKSRCS